MKKKQLTIAVLLVAALGVAAVVPVVAIVSKWDQKSHQSAGKSRVVVEVRDEKSGEHYRKRTLSADGTRLVEIEVAYRDGGIGHQYFREDGTLRDEEHRWGNGNLKKRTQYSSDGKTVVSGETHRVDGTLETGNVRLADGTRDERDYHSDGTTVAAHRVTDRSGNVVLREAFRTDGTQQSREVVLADGNKEKTTWFDNGKQVQKHSVVDRWGHTVYLEEEFRADGSAVSKTERLTNGTTETKLYSPTGNLQMHRLKPSYGEEVTTYYREDGTTISQKFTVQYSNAEGWFYRPDGSLEQHRRFGYYSMDVDVYGADGKTVAYRQHWRKKSGSYYFSDPADYELDSVEICDDQGRTIKEQSFEDDGARVTQAIDYDADADVKTAVRTYRDDGTLEKEEKFDAEGTVTETKEHKPEDNIREPVDPVHVKQLDYIDPRHN